MAKHRSVEGYVPDLEDEPPIVYQATITSEEKEKVIAYLKKKGVDVSKVVATIQGQWALLLDEGQGRLKIYSRLNPIFGKKYSKVPPYHDFKDVDINSEEIRQILTGEQTDPDINRAKKTRSQINKRVRLRPIEGG